MEWSVGVRINSLRHALRHTAHEDLAVSGFAAPAPFDPSYIKTCYNEISLCAILHPVDERENLADTKVKALRTMFLITMRTRIPHKFAKLAEAAITLYVLAEMALSAAYDIILCLYIFFTISKMKPIRLGSLINFFLRAQSRLHLILEVHMHPPGSILQDPAPCYTGAWANSMGSAGKHLGNKHVTRILMIFERTQNYGTC